MRSGAVAVVLGSAVGIVAGFAWQSAQTRDPLPAREPSGVQAPAVSVTQTAVAAPSAAPTNDAVNAATQPPATPAALATESATSALEPPSAPATSAAPGSSSSSMAPVFPFAVPLPPVANKSELGRAEVRCYEVDPEECGRAADAYDAGALVPRDAARADKLRKVELVRLVRRCEERSPHACLVLAGLYESGESVDENDRHARALVEHARDLCRHGAKATAECVNGEPK